MALAGTGIVGLTYLLGRRYFGERVALAGAGISAVYAYLIFYSASLVTETPFTLAVLASIYFAGSVEQNPSVKNWLLLGLALTVAVHARMAVIFFVPLLLLWTLYKARGARLVHAALPLAMIALSIAPFTYWNYQTWGRFVPLQTQFGHVFWNGNHPGHHGNFHPFKVFEIPEEVLALDNDALITSRLLEMGIANVRENPGDFLSLTITRLREMFVFWPTESSSTAANILRVLSFGLVAPWALGGLILNWKRWRELVPILLFVLTHVGIHAVTWTMIRYRVPMDPFLILLAASALVRTQEVVFPRSVAEAAA
jgi:4-amino-4-deoxy-L-arabinose transferase-like glycosyltransferase